MLSASGTLCLNDFLGWSLIAANEIPIHIFSILLRPRQNSFVTQGLHTTCNTHRIYRVEGLLAGFRDYHITFYAT